tara:strand:- start:1069 stop:1224 length:156 start_codon:yes stop_codon:yes gene_type:complete
LGPIHEWKHAIKTQENKGARRTGREITQGRKGEESLTTSIKSEENERGCKG